MITYPRYRIYECFTSQEGTCGHCKEKVNIHDMEVENIVSDQLLCCECLKIKSDIVSNLENNYLKVDSEVRSHRLEHESTDSNQTSDIVAITSDSTKGNSPPPYTQYRQFTQPTKYMSDHMQYRKSMQKVNRQSSQERKQTAAHEKCSRASQMEAFDKEYVMNVCRPELYQTDFSYVNQVECHSEHEDDVDPEDSIKSSWYHRAVLGDERRRPYTDEHGADFQHVDWEHLNWTDSDEDEFHDQLGWECK